LTEEYDSALEFLYGFIDYERTPRWKYDDEHFDLTRMAGYLESLGGPHRTGRFVHVAGTNGKGSVAAMVAKALFLSGHRTGLYTSPHLISFRERIRIDGVSIPEREVVEEVVRIKEATARFRGLTFFEVWTALAFDYFARGSVDVSVIEAGLGGRLDATNVVTPDVSVITSVSMDHRGILGETLGKIAAEKAGIIKPGVPVVSALQKPEVSAVIEEKAAEAGAELVVVGRDVEFHESGNGLCYRGKMWSLEDVAVPLGGAFQMENAAVALAVLETLASRGIGVTAESAREALETVKWPGRLHVVSENPDVIVDGACNTSAMGRVCDFISSRRAKEKTVAVVAMCRDKEVEEVLSVLGGCVSRFIVTEVDNPRMLGAEVLAGKIPPHIPWKAVPDPAGALDEAVSAAGNDGQVVATGSLYLVGEVLKHYGVERIEKI